jgi:hypothetical protein
MGARRVILFLDISSTCTGYAVADKGKIAGVGVKWFPKEWKTPEKCIEMSFWVNTLCQNRNVEKIVYERYSFNMKNPNGALACPQIQGAVFAGSLGSKQLEDITPQTWRKHCGLKKAKTENWKQVTEAHFRALYDIPEKIESNVTGNLRTTPSDYFDALGICIGWHKMKGLDISWEPK